MLDLEDILTFAEVAESGGLTRAGERLGLARKTLHDRIRRLGLDADAYRGS